jgi:hypothetical protein
MGGRVAPTASVRRDGGAAQSAVPHRGSAIQEPHKVTNVRASAFALMGGELDRGAMMKKRRLASKTIDALIADGERRRHEELMRDARRNVLIADYIQREKSYADTWDCGCISSGLTGRLYKACDEHAEQAREDNAKADAKLDERLKHFDRYGQ